jgi:hypothetical protein
MCLVSFAFEKQPYIVCKVLRFWLVNTKNAYPKLLLCCAAFLARHKTLCNWKGEECLGVSNSAEPQRGPQMCIGFFIHPSCVNLYQP